MYIAEELFREDYLFTREDILKSLELFVEHEKLNEEPSYSAEVVKNRIKQRTNQWSVFYICTKMMMFFNFM